MKKNEEGLLMDHDYDGIQELDHDLPRWWLWLFYITIIFSAWYIGYYMSGFGPSSQQELTVAMNKIEAMKPQVPSPSEPGGGDNLADAVNDPAKVKHGSEVYQGKCLACHGDKAQGVIGPNLTDEFWLHGSGTLQDIAAVVAAGIPEKGMPPWGPILTPDELADVVAFIRSVRGSNPAGAKAPQGDKQEYKD